MSTCGSTGVPDWSALAGQLNLVNARVVRAAEQLLVEGGWDDGGQRSPAGFLAWKLGLSPSRAETIVKVAQRRADFPVLIGAFDRGELSLEQVAAAIEAPAWADALIMDFCTIATVTKIRRGMRSNLFEHDPDQPVPPKPTPTDRVSYGVARNGRWRLNAELGIDDGRLVEQALRERKDAIFDTGDTDVTASEAFVDCFARSLGAVESVTRREHYRTWIHLETNGDATLTDGWRIPIALRDELLCDGVTQPVWERDGIPFSLGRTQRAVPERTRRIIQRRDRGCRVPGCSATFVDIHHIVHWLDGGTTDTWNLISLCKRHHRMHHRGKLGITGNADIFDAVEFTDATGNPITTSRPTPPTSQPPTPNVPYAPPLAGRFDWNWIGLGWIHPNAKRKRLEQLEQHLARQRGTPTAA